MNLDRTVIDELRVAPGSPARLHHRSTSATRASWLLGDGKPRELAQAELEAFRTELEAKQELLYASDRVAVLVILQALDAAGKDGTIKHVMSGVNPQGCTVTAFKAPTPDELNHDFLWRCAKALPARGQIGIFNRSYFEEVLVARVHPEVIIRESLPEESGHGRALWEERFEDINSFERHLVRNGTKVVKVFLHVSKDEQRRRFLQRLEDPERQWKFSLADLTERTHFDEYTRAYDEMLSATSTEWAPWYVIPADHKYMARALVGGILVHAIDSLDLRLPPADAERTRALDAARASLLAE
ncbi:MAG TPA: PPK2 family polyphosphate kinase [Acidimicrobiales bacterium]|nr:PPK2 family polyphosphate kinase [Acidimicrobiales bacterium]